MQADDYRIRRWGEQAVLPIDVPVLLLPFSATRAKNIVEARSRLPTSWTIQVFATSTGDLPGDFLSVFLDLQIGLGSGRLDVPIPLTGTVFGAPLIVPATDITASIRVEFFTALLGPARIVNVIGSVLVAPFVHAPGDHKVRPETVASTSPDGYIPMGRLTDEYAHIGSGEAHGEREDE